MKDTLVNVVNAIDNIVVDAETNEDNLNLLAEVRTMIVNKLKRDYKEDVLIGDLGVCVCHCHEDLSIEFDSDQCVSCMCYNPFRNTNRP